MFDGSARPRIGNPDVVWGAVDNEIAYGGVSCDVISLVKKADRHMAGVGDPTRIWFQHSRKNLEHGGLSRSIAAHDPDHLAATEPQTDAVEQRSSAVDP